MNHYGHHRHGGIGPWIIGGIGLGIGLMIFHLIVVGLAFLAVGFWVLTEDWTPFCRFVTRGFLVAVAVCAALLELATLLGE